MATLYIVATPIGNLKDITIRAIEILSSVGVIACEDTRRTGKLLAAINLPKRPELFSLTDYNEQGKSGILINTLVSGIDVALVSDAGSPLFSDPGYTLIKEAVSAGIRVESIPGPSALISAVQVSGLPGDRVLSWGFLPKKRNDKKAVFVRVLRLSEITPMTVVYFDSPFRIKESLEILAELAPTADVAIARELTKLHEEVIRGRPGEIVSHLPEKLQGELVLVVRVTY